MSHATTTPAQLASALMWEQLSDRVDALCTAWSTATEPPMLAEFLPLEPANLRRLTLLEVIKVDLEYRWTDGRWPKQIEQYVADFPELSAEGHVPCDIIYEEFHIRKQRGDAVKSEEYFERFPDLVDELRRLFDLESPEQTAALVPTEKMPTFESGQTVDDFELLRPLGKGAFATVFLARQKSMQRMVALKISRDRGFEPQTLAQLDHQNIVRVYDQRQLADQKIRLLYMQYVAGGTLQSVIEHSRSVPAPLRSGATMLAAIDQSLSEKGEQPPTDSMTRHKLQRANWAEVVCWLGARLASALEYAHQRGVLHRDVKPANVLVGADGHPKLADFNISFSKLDGATPAAYFGGSLAYMSPEQLEACDPAHSRQPDELDGRSDVYSLAVLLWEAMTGRRPFSEDSLKTWSKALGKMSTVRRAGVTKEAIAQVPRECPARVVDVLLKALEPDMAKRHESAGEFARDLDLCLQPRAHRLLRNRSSWRAVLKRHPVASSLGIGLLPNIVMCIINIVYNQNEIIRSLGPEDQSSFLSLLLKVNVVSYAIGLTYICWPRRTVFGELVRLARGEKVDPPPSVESVKRLLLMGYHTAVITALLWTLSGFIIPAWTQLGAGPLSQLGAAHYRHFIVSNLLCGMITATQSYYVVTFLNVRLCYPWLIQSRMGRGDEPNLAAGVIRRNRIFLGLTFSVPFLALFALVFLHMGEETVNLIVIGALGGIGIIGCGLGYLLDLTIRSDLGALAGAMSPAGDALLSGDTLDSHLMTGTR